MQTLNRRVLGHFYTSVKNLSRMSSMEAFKQHGVISDVIDSAPKALASLTYGSTNIKPGDVMTPTQVKSPPKVEWSAQSGSYYTMIMNDPDAPSRKEPTFGEWNHWLVVNIPDGKLADGQTMSEYIGAGPPPDTGLHRYVFLVFKQKGKQEFSGLTRLTNRSADNRPKWKVRDFAKKYNLEDLVAGNFFQAEFDDYVPKLYAQLDA